MPSVGVFFLAAGLTLTALGIHEVVKGVKHVTHKIERVFHPKK